MADPQKTPAGLPITYQGDFYSWTLDQARHLRTGNHEAIDRENLADEIESLGREQFNKLESALRVLKALPAHKRLTSSPASACPAGR